jgi:hypothetical protein
MNINGNYAVVKVDKTKGAEMIARMNSERFSKVVCFDWRYTKISISQSTSKCRINRLKQP